MADINEHSDEEIDYNTKTITLSLDIFTTIPPSVTCKQPKRPKSTINIDPDPDVVSLGY